MLKLGTVFSGIGAIEHALERMGIDYQIEFACDNGDVDIFSKKVGDNFNEITDEITYLKKTSNPVEGLDLIRESLNKINDEVKVTEVNEEELLSILDNYSKSGQMNRNQKSAYESIEKKIHDSIDVISKKVEFMKLSIKLESDINRSELSQSEKKELLKIVNNTHYKKLLKELKMLSEKLSMIHEKENLEIMREKVFALGSLKEQKEFVDNLYEGQESKNKVMQSYLANYDIEPSNFHWNVAFLDGTHFRDKIDLFVGGSPCQSFSLVGKQRGLDDTRGTLFYEYARLVGEIQPKVFIYENVRAVLSNDNGETWKTMSKIFDDLGYDWSYQVLNAKDYGVPQNRERVFVVGFRKDLGITNFKFPDPIELTSSMKDYLLDNVSGKYYLPKKGVEFVTSEKNLDKRYTQIDGDIQLCQKKNQQFNWHGDFVFVEENTNQEKLMEDLEKYFLSEKVKKYVLSTGTKGFYSKPEIDLDIARPLLQSMHKMHRAGIDNYVTTEGRLRKLTPRECLRLMGFCDSFKIVVSDTSAYQQSGNSIVVDVLMKICEEIFNKLKS
ncbi:DNA cytosine methyltransferase [Streptococcus suis]|uniref:Cytosine-specific methyltransferase n=3 Tax=Streptococcus suis TaxID=1307 RepID=A0A0Z8KP54_STRSU|nr:DNA cytosine methyltransferase [Streptococcus suis]MCK3870798.1 DNA cytosine methyltransferase [Streptococcus suis]NQG75391.1 DNA cytosine methyltransferase [Streptococcus suis]NQG79259.1 DNA cytosine methyltransferase [Streptococcus suis]NQM89528.1 DNA cytosine methyltransferase [Streptococcus suis]NQN06826.1 DNA cytosine methyltransferase [Streptococcus suis]